MSDAALELPVSPWAGRASAAAGVGALVSLVVVIIGWEGVSNEARFDDAQPWFVVGVVGLLVGFAAAVFWLSTAAKRIRGVRLECHALLRAEFGPGSDKVGVANASSGPVRFVRAAGMVKVHLDSCELMTGKDHDEVIPGADAARCGVCLP